nr:immunoglobulin heavy chain junction region [Macaca mulatta]
CTLFVVPMGGSLDVW